MNGLLNKFRDRSETCPYVVLLFLICSVSCFYCKTDRSDKKLGRAAKSVLNETYYVDNKKGDDKNPGTIKRPLKSISEVNRRLKNKPASLFFSSGQVFEGALLLNNIGGTEETPIEISSWGDGRAVINGGNSEAIRVEDCHNLWINNLDIIGNGRKNGNTSNGLAFVRTRNSSIEQLKAEGFQKSGVDLFDCTGIQVKKVLAADNGFCGINVMGSDKKLSGKILIEDCKAENNPGDPTILDNHSGNGILVGISDSVIIDHCTATNNGWDMPRQGNGPVGIWTWQSDHITIQYCISYRNKTSKGAKDGGGFDLDGGVTNSVIQYCLSYENQGAGYGLFQYPGASDWSNNIVRYCVSINDAQTTDGAGSIFIWNGSNVSSQLTNCMIYNNVAYNASAPVISFENASAHKNFTFCNNIFLGTGEVITGLNTGSSFIGNVWWRTEGSIKFMGFGNLADWSKATGQEMLKGKIAGIQADPGFNGPFITDIIDPYKLSTLYGYTLRPDSPLRNKGLDIKSISGIDLPRNDFYGKHVPLGAATEQGIFEME
jgi:hypothetical protein